MKRYLFAIMAWFLFVFFVNKTFYRKPFDFKKFSTAKGEIDIKEINENVFKPYGYSLVKNALIPILKKKNEATCDEIFLSWQQVADKGLTEDPPKEIPNPAEFLLNNYSKLDYFYSNETPKNNKKNLKNWNQTYIDNWIKAAKNNPSNVPHSYRREPLAVYAATKHNNIKGKIGAVIGSEIPWAEAYALANGAKHISTVDYYALTINHPQMDFLYAPDLPSKKEKYYNTFDFIISFSSIEHSGLGRYGDPIDSIGDIREMNKIHCMLKPKGLLFVGFPVGLDKITFNAHRIYGRIRLAMMFEGFKLLKIYFNDEIISEEDMEPALKQEKDVLQYLFVLEKNEDI